MHICGYMHVCVASVCVHICLCAVDRRLIRDGQVYVHEGVGLGLGLGFAHLGVGLGLGLGLGLRVRVEG